LDNEWFSGNTEIVDSTPPLSFISGTKGNGLMAKPSKAKVDPIASNGLAHLWRSWTMGVDMGSLKSSQLAWGS
jgi:hypothetical protein